MSLLALTDAQAQCRVDSDYPVAQLQPYIDGAEAAAVAYLNRTVFATQDALDAAQDTVPVTLATAGQTYSDALAAAALLTDLNQQQAAIDVAQARMDAATLDAARTVHGIVVNAAILAAIRLLLGHLFLNREAVSNGAAELPLGACDLLRPYRRMMTP